MNRNISNIAKSLSVLTLALGLTAVTVSPAQAQNARGRQERAGQFFNQQGPNAGEFFEGRRGGNSLFTARLMKQLGLSDDQKAEVQELNQAHRDEVKDIQEDIAELREELGEIMNAAEPDAKAADKIAVKIGKQQAEIHKQAIGLQLELRKVLTDGQKSQLKTICEKNSERRAEAKAARAKFKELREQFKDMSPAEKRELLQTLRDAAGPEEGPNREAAPGQFFQRGQRGQ